jgi:hypothetical protein
VPSLLSRRTTCSSATARRCVGFAKARRACRMRRIPVFGRRRRTPSWHNLRRPGHKPPRCCGSTKRSQLKEGSVLQSTTTPGIPSTVLTGCSGRGCRSASRLGREKRYLIFKPLWQPGPRCCVFCRGDHRFRPTLARRSSRGARCVAGRRNHRLPCAASRDCLSRCHGPAPRGARPRRSSI